MQGYDTLYCSHTDVLECVSLPAQIQTHRGKETACVACALQDCTFTTPACTSVGMNTKAGEHRCLLQEELVSHGGLVYTE